MEHFDLTAAIIFGVATIQGILIIVNLLFQKKGTRIANGLLIALVLCVTLIVFQNFIVFSGLYKKLPKLIMLFYSLNGLKGPLFFLFVVFLLNPKRRFKRYDLLHGLVFMYMLYTQWEFLFLKDEYKILTIEYIYYGEGRLNAASLYWGIIGRFIPIVYAVAAVGRIRSKIKELKSWSSNTNLQYLSRFQLTAYVVVFFSIAFLTLGIYSYSFQVPMGRYEMYHHVLNSSILMMLALVTVHQPERLIFILESEVKTKKLKPKNSQAAANLKQLILKEKYYLNPDLKLYDLAKLTDTLPHVLSEQINQEMNMNFYEFINQYRVKEFKERIISNQYNHLTFLAIALDVGFNSKASFNRIFKKHTGMTPSEFKASILKDLHPGLPLEKPRSTHAIDLKN